MDMNTAIDNILRNYGELAEVDRPTLERLFDSAFERGLTVTQAYNGLRLVYGVNFQQQEYFSVKEVSEMLEVSESDLLDEMQRQGIKPEQTKGNVYYFPNGI